MRNLFLALFVLILGITGAAHAAPQALKPKNEHTLQWLMYELPPFIKLASGDLEVDLDKAQGAGADQYRILRDSLPQYEHRFFKVPFARAEHLFKEKNQLCSLLLQETPERSEYLYFGDATALMVPVGLITLKSIDPHKYIETNGIIDMQKTLESKKFRLGIVKGRSYSPQLNPLLTDKKPYSVVSDGTAGGLLAMVSTQRLDGLLGYYLEMAAYEQAVPKTPPLQFHQLKEASRYLDLKPSCEKTPWGKKALAAISKVTKEQKFKERALDYFVSMLPEGRRQEYIRLYQASPQAQKK